MKKLNDLFFSKLHLLSKRHFTYERTIRAWKRSLLSVALVMFPLLSYSQLDQIAVFMTTGKEDAMKLTEAYVAPYVNALGSNLSGGWYNSARPHQLGGFNLTLAWNFAFVPAMDQQFNLDDIGLSANASIDKDNTMAPTAAGDAGDGPEIGYGGTTFNTPGGTGLPFMSTPMITAAVGLPKGIELMGRYLPPVSLGKNGTLNLWGVGVKHDVVQYMGIIDRMPAFNLSLMAGYTRVNSGVALATGNATSMGDYELRDPSLDFTIGSFTSNVLVGFTLPVIAIYGGVGFATSNADLVMNGFYINDQEDPIVLNIKNSSGGVLNPRLNAGFRLRMSLVAFHVDYTYADYSVLTAGVGLSFR